MTLEEHTSRLEAKVDHVQSDISEMKGDIREMRQEFRQDMRRLDDKVDGLREEGSSNFRWLLGAYGGGVILILGFVYFLFSQI